MGCIGGSAPHQHPAPRAVVAARAPVEPQAHAVSCCPSQEHKRALSRGALARLSAEEIKRTRLQDLCRLFEGFEAELEALEPVLVVQVEFLEGVDVLLHPAADG